METTRPLFIVGTGRCGTRSLYKLLAGTPGIEIHHEYACTQVQQTAALHAMGRLMREQVMSNLQALYGSAMYYSPEPLWIDSSNKASWVIAELYELFPTARFLALVRDGRKVASSFFNKLAPEIYDDESVSILTRWLEQPEKFPMPPPEKKYWWLIPQPGQPFHETFPSFNQFQRVCYHWQNCNHIIGEQFSTLPEDTHLTVKLEELTSDRDVLQQVCEFIDTPYDEEMFETLQTPQNVFFPMDFQLIDEQLDQFHEICSPMMKALNYEETEIYTVDY